MREAGRGLRRKKKRPQTMSWFLTDHDVFPVFLSVKVRVAADKMGVEIKNTKMSIAQRGYIIQLALFAKS